MEINHGVFVIPTQYIIETRNDGQESSHLPLTVDQCHKKCLDKQQERNGPLDLRAKVLISDSILSLKFEIRILNYPGIYVHVAEALSQLKVNKQLTS